MMLQDLTPTQKVQYARVLAIISIMVAANILLLVYVLAVMGLKVSAIAIAFICIVSWRIMVWPAMRWTWITGHAELDDQNNS